MSNGGIDGVANDRRLSLAYREMVIWLNVAASAYRNAAVAAIVSINEVMAMASAMIISEMALGWLMKLSGVTSM
jgi:hypothetical protein